MATDNPNIKRGVIRGIRDAHLDTDNVLEHEVTRLTEDIGEGLKTGQSIGAFDTELRVIEVLNQARKDVQLILHKTQE